MDFEQLKTEYADDYVAEAMYARELEWFQYDFDRRNFQDMVDRMAEGPEREALRERIRQINTQIKIVEDVYESLKNRVRSPEAHAAAVARVSAKRAAG